MSSPEDFLAGIASAIAFHMQHFALWIVLLLFLPIARAFFRRPGVKGWLGERRVASALERQLPDDDYDVFHDVYLPRPDGRGTAQIDHLIVSRFGIFAIETKNMTGWIFGDENGRQWTQTIYRKKSRFQNPIHQNAMHVRAVASAFQIAPEKLYNLVIFAGEAELKREMPPTVFTRISDLQKFVRGKKLELIEPAQCVEISNELLRQQNAPDRRRIRKTHVAQLAARHS